jgi:ABC-type glycerol-3-phosphate transport system substrate-binding protein
VEKLQVLISGGEPPDVWDGPSSAEQLVGLNVLEPLDPLIKRDKVDLKRFNQKHLERGAMFRDQMWLSPKAYTGNALCLALNVDLFKQAGVAVPSADSKSSWTWQQFVDSLLKLTKTGSSGDVAQFGILAFGSTTYTPPPLWEADWVSADLKTITCDSAAMQECYTSFFDLPFKYHVLPRLGEGAQLFGSANPFFIGKAAATVVAPFSIPQFTQTKNVEIALAPMPRAKRSTPDLSGDYLGIPKGAKEVQEAWQFLKWLNDGSRYAKFVGKVPAETTQVEPWIRDQFKSYADPRPQVVASAIENAGAGVNLGRHPKLTQLSNVILPAMNNDIWLQKLAPADFLRSIKPQLQDIVDGKAG